MTYQEWLEYGIQHGYCTHSFCAMHDSGPMTEEEEAEADDGGDPCCVVVRLGSASNGYWHW